MFLEVSGFPLYQPPTSIVVSICSFMFFVHAKSSWETEPPASPRPQHDEPHTCILVLCLQHYLTFHVFFVTAAHHPLVPRLRL